MEQKWLANGSAVLVLDPGNGEPTEGDGNNGQRPNPDYRPALVAVLATEYHEPGQVLDADPLAADDELGPTATGSGTPGELRGPLAPVQPAPAPQAIPGPATPTTSTRSTAAEDPNVTAPGSAAAVGFVPVGQIIASIRDLEARAEAGDESAQAELDSLSSAFEADPELDRDDADDVAGRGTVATDAGVSTAPDVPETASGGNGEAPGSAPPGSSTTTP